MSLWTTVSSLPPAMATSNRDQHLPIVDRSSNYASAALGKKEDDGLPLALKLSDILVDEFANDPDDVTVPPTHPSSVPDAGESLSRLTGSVGRHDGTTSSKPQDKYEPYQSSMRPSKIKSESALWAGSERLMPSTIENYHQAPWTQTNGPRAVKPASNHFPVAFQALPEPPTASQIPYSSGGPPERRYNQLPTPPYTPVTLPRPLPVIITPQVVHIPEGFVPSSFHSQQELRYPPPRPVSNVDHPATLAPKQINGLVLPDPNAVEFMRRKMGLRKDDTVNLHSIPDTTDGSRPGIPLHQLIGLAICGSERQRLPLKSIENAIADRFTYYFEYRYDASWKNSIRHALSLYKMFVQMPRDVDDPGKGAYWTISTADGEGYARKRNRKKGKAAKKPTPKYEDSDDDSFLDSSSESEEVEAAERYHPYARATRARRQASPIVTGRRMTTRSGAKKALQL
ncbi:Fork-head domain-containing protein [Mycena indigotica]|uniref:Fork-head domain-containing protein n=1 Tax=Mycena indigotica TaxID=2126181 RepID=A0A8H6T751_9AGAR|nr:Fork-head domain-containing protein [Mycena indigotica]KAF7312019.1 Fork-head domain-containing protein [Mycena indigotica]